MWSLHGSRSCVALWSIQQLLHNCCVTRVALWHVHNCCITSVARWNIQQLLHNICCSLKYLTIVALFYLTMQQLLDRIFNICSITIPLFLKIFNNGCRRTVAFWMFNNSCNTSVACLKFSAVGVWEKPAGCILTTSSTTMPQPIHLLLCLLTWLQKLPRYNQDRNYWPLTTVLYTHTSTPVFQTLQTWTHPKH